MLFRIFSSNYPVKLNSAGNIVILVIFCFCDCFLIPSYWFWLSPFPGLKIGGVQRAVSEEMFLSKVLEHIFNFRWHNFKTNLVQFCLAVYFFFYLLWMCSLMSLLCLGRIITKIKQFFAVTKTLINNFSFNLIHQTISISE